jgi:putative ABC transport system permease protein
LGTRAVSGPLANTQEGFISAQQRVIAGDYFRAVGMNLVAGRAFDARDGVGMPRTIIVSRSVASRLLPGLDPLGQRLRTGWFEATIIGVVNDVALDVEGRLEPHVYHSHRQFAGNRNWSLVQVIATNGEPVAVQPSIRRELASIDPQLVMHRPTTFEDAIGQGTAQRRFTLGILGAFAMVALALAALGLFGVLSYAVKLRGREIGIRLALGADTSAIRRMVLRQGIAVTTLGIALGLLGAVALSGSMSSLVFGVSPLHPGVLGGAAAFMLVVAAITAYLPARRATMLDPRTVLQGE